MIDGAHDLLLVLSISQSQQTSNKYTGGYASSVQMNLTQVYCPFAQQTAPPGQAVWGESTSGNYDDYYFANPISGIGAVAALLTSPWVNKYRLWLTVPGSILDAFSHQSDVLNGTIYCATVQAMIRMLQDQQVIDFERVSYTRGAKQVSGELQAFRVNAPQGDVTTMLRVNGLAECRKPQPVEPQANDARIFVYPKSTPTTLPAAIPVPLTTR